MKALPIILLYAAGLILLVVLEHHSFFSAAAVIGLVMSIGFIWWVIRDHNNMSSWQKFFVGSCLYFIANFGMVALMNLTSLLFGWIDASKPGNVAPALYVGLIPILIFLKNYTFEIKRKSV